MAGLSKRRLNQIRPVCQSLEQRLAPAALFGYALRIGGTGIEQSNAIATDPAGNVYIAGQFSGTTDFDPGTGEAIRTSKGGNDVFVAKYSPNGELIWLDQMGGILTDQASAMTLDSAGNIFITGMFQGGPAYPADFDPGPSAFNMISANGSRDAFVSKLDNNGNFVWAKAMSGLGLENGHGIGLDSAGNVYTTGEFDGTVDFDPDAGIVNITSAGAADTYIEKMDANGALVWVKSLAGVQDNIANSMAVDSSGAVVTVGWFYNTVDFDPGPGTYSLVSSYAKNIFISKLDTDGNFAWAKRIGGSVGADVGYGIAVDTANDVYTTGIFGGTVDFDPGPGTANLSPGIGGMNPFISKLSPAGDYVWAKVLSCSGNSTGFAITVGANDHVYSTGSYSFTMDLDPGPGTSNYASIGNTPDMYVSELTSAGDFVWGGVMGGPSSGEKTYSIAAAPSGAVYTTGVFDGTSDFDPGPGVANLTSANIYPDVFVSALTQHKTQVSSIVINGGAAQRSRVTDIAVSFDDTVTFQGDPAAAFALTPNTGITLNVATSVVSGHTVANITIGGPASEFGSLPDGKYQLTVLANQVVGGLATGDYMTTFKRLFGDADGNGTVNSVDFAAFRAAFGVGPSVFDFDNDGQTNSNDFAQFRKRFGLSV